MSDRSNIEWTDSTFNPWVGCTKVGPGCDHCYAEAMMDTRLGRANWGAGNPRVRTSVANWRKPLQWNREPFAGCNECGWRGVPIKGETGYQCAACRHVNLAPQRRRVFCASLADVFDNEVDPQWRADLFALIRATPHLDWLLLTKRIGNAASMIEAALKSVGEWNASILPAWPWPNVWLGATVVNQAEADRDIPKLLATPAAVRFLSIEPMLGPIDLNRVRCPNFRVLGSALNGAGYQSRIDWIIAGGESGPHARPSHPDWFRALRDQCAAAGVPFLFKQWGEHAPNWLTDATGNKVPGSEWIDRMGKKAAGRTLDGAEHTAFPSSPAAP